MNADLANSVVCGIALYLAVGIIWAILFLTMIVGRADPAAKNMTFKVKFLISPGVVLLWPYLLVRSLLGKGVPEK